MLAACGTRRCKKRRGEGGEEVDGKENVKEFFRKVDDEKFRGFYIRITIRVEILLVSLGLLIPSSHAKTLTVVM